jgi:hypothetical protein
VLYKKIYLHNNQIGDEGASVIDEALKINESLEKVDLRFNHEINQSKFQQIGKGRVPNRVRICLQ